MNGDDFLSLLLSEFPALASEVREHHGLLHVQMGVFARHTQAAIKVGDMETLDRCFALADRGFSAAEPNLQNAFYVSYLEHLDFAGEHAADAHRRMTPLLQTGYAEIMDYLEQLFRPK